MGVRFFDFMELELGCGAECFLLVPEMRFDHEPQSLHTPGPEVRIKPPVQDAES